MTQMNQMNQIINLDINNIKKIGIDSYVAQTPKEIFHAKKIILPGVGSFDPGMTQLKNNGFHNTLKISCTP